MTWWNLKVQGLCLMSFIIYRLKNETGTVGGEQFIRSLKCLKNKFLKRSSPKLIAFLKTVF